MSRRLACGKVLKLVQQVNRGVTSELWRLAYPGAQGTADSRPLGVEGVHRQLHELSAADAADRIRRREISSAELVEALLARVAATDRCVQAWETVVAERARARARRADAMLARAKPGRLGALHGVPFGVKDVIATRGVRTACGFGPFDQRVPARNADVVSRLERAGAILLGKTVTTQFAWAQPSRTRNPWRLDRSPGGSSSGSGAAVAARHVPLALGTQTAGSTLRPAAYTGVVGFKPSFARVSTRGVFPLAPTLDHVGCIARSVEDCRLFLSATSPLHPEGTRETEGDGLAALRSAPTLGILREALDRSSPFVASHLEAVARRFSADGSDVREVAIEVPLARAVAVHRITIQYEAARTHKRLMQEYPGPQDYGPITRAYLEAGMQVSRSRYLEAQLERHRFIAALDSCLASVDALLLPTVGDVAPSLDTTGDSSLQAPFTMAGVPAISLPSGISPEGLPVGIQLIGRRGSDEHLLSIAQWCEERLDPIGQPMLTPDSLPAPGSLESDCEGGLEHP